MPAFVTHELLGTQVFSMLDEPIAEMLELNPSPYFWGLQGPDLLFFRDAVFGRSMLPKYGNIMHTQKTDELFAAMSCYLNLHKGRKQYETLAAYILGFAGHYCLDREAHPYVYFKQIQKERVLDDDLKRGIHMRIESDIDTAFYEMKTGKNIRKYRPASRLFGSEWEYEVIARLYVIILWEVYGIRVKESEIKKCFTETRMLMRLLLDRKGYMIRMVGAAESLLALPNRFSPHIRRKKVKEDILNLNNDSWFHLDHPEKVDHRSFPQLFYVAAYQAADMMESIYNCSEKGIIYEPKNLPSFDNGSPESAGYAE